MRELRGKREKRKLLAKFLELAVLGIFSSHACEFGGRTFCQEDGGHIGLALSGAIGRTTMAVWDQKLGELCRKNGIQMKFRCRNVDDCNAAFEAWVKVWRWG